MPWHSIVFVVLSYIHPISRINYNLNMIDLQNATLSFHGGQIKISKHTNKKPNSNKKDQASLKCFIFCT